jgi:hypothetical protein
MPAAIHRYNPFFSNDLIFTSVLLTLFIGHFAILLRHYSGSIQVEAKAGLVETKGND